MSIWGKGRDEVEKPFKAAVAPLPVPAKKESLSVSSMPNLTARESEPRGAVIGKAVKIVGQIFSKEDLFVDGDVEGTIELLEHKLTVGPNGKVHASVKARDVVVLGTVQGNVEASDRIEIKKDAHLVGDIKTARIVIEDGAYFKGSIDIVKVEVKVEQKPAPQAKQPVAASHVSAAPAVAAGEGKR
jgi:cytoskeletal protein CcmA (bactofilin family)